MSVKDKVQSFESKDNLKKIVYKPISNTKHDTPLISLSTESTDIKYDNFSNDRIENIIKDDVIKDPVIVFEPREGGAPFKIKNVPLTNKTDDDDINYHDNCSFYEILNYYFCCCNDFLKNYE